MDNVIYFASQLAKQDLSELDLSIAILWYAQTAEGSPGLTAREIATNLQRLNLRGEINISRLKAKLRADKRTIHKKEADNFSINLNHRHSLDEAYMPLAKVIPTKTDDHILPDEEFNNLRPYLKKIQEQINGCYHFRYFDSCAVMMRRLMESLLIECYESGGHASAIKSGKDYSTLKDIILITKGGSHLRLSRGACDIAEKIKEVGDAAAHSRTYITKQRDIDEHRTGYRRLITELLEFATRHTPQQKKMDH